MDLRPLTDDILIARIEALVSGERESIADIVEHLAEMDRREIAVDRGYLTLFDYCRKRLGYSEAAAYLRIRAARAANRFPRILADLRAGTIHLDAVMRLYPHLSEENSDEVLNRAAGASKREVLALTARFGSTGTAPERETIRYLPAKAPAITGPPPAPATPKESTPAEANAVVSPPSRIRLAFTVDDEFLVMLERLKDLRRHKFPSGRLEEIIKDALAGQLDRIDPDRRRPRHPEPKNGSIDPGEVKRSRRIPQAVKAEVWTRDGGRCAYTSPDGRRCESRSFLEYDHVLPWALGGRSDSAGNVRLLCRPHNQRAARRRFGPRADRRRPPPETGAGRDQNMS